MNGFELSRKLRGIDNKIKVCFLTAADLGYYGETDCFIAKPVNNIDLINRLKVILSQE